VAAGGKSGGHGFSIRSFPGVMRVMKTFLAVILISIASAPSAVAQATTTILESSPAERGIAVALGTIREKPNQYSSYNLLAAALLRRARETEDSSYYGQAAEAVKKSEELSPNNFETEKIRVSILLGQHDFAAALEAARALNRKVPDDVMVYGLLADADTELGKYVDAEKAAQWMLNLRPGNRPALLHAATLRELFGDLDGSYELLDLAYQTTPSTETEERAWILSQMGHLQGAAGRAELADKLLQQALVAFANYPYALGALGQLRVSQSRYEDAVNLFQQRYQAAPRAVNLYELAEAMQLAGRNAEAKKAFADFETKALAEASNNDNANRDLIFYYADHARQPAKALNIAQQEFSRRQDVYTLDAYAWALHVKGRDTEARQQIAAALAVGIRDTKLFRHAGEIAIGR
jgi:tetratricopeptide (TPR) repeat protein